MSAPAVEETGQRRVLRGVTWCGLPGSADVAVADGRIVQIDRTSGEPQWFCLPPLADLHVHANRSFTPVPGRPRDLMDASRMAQELFQTFTEQDYCRHAGLLLSAAYTHGTTRVRSHADIDPAMGLAAVSGSLLAKADFAGRVEMEVVAFASSSCDPATAEGRSMLRQAVAEGADLLGAVPAFGPDPAATIDAVLELAADLDVPADLHLDEHLDPKNSWSGYLAEATGRFQLEGRVTLSHGCAIGALAPGDQQRVIDELRSRDITVIALPRTNLYLQGRDHPTLTPRGLAPVRSMVEAGVSVRFASDNVRDVFYPFGDADLLGVAMDGLLAGHLDDSRHVVAAICAGRSGFVEGDPADMVIVPGDDADQVLSTLPEDRWLMRSGRVFRTPDG